MKPTTEQILSALNKLVRENKTELKTEKVELSIVTEAKQLVKDYYTILDKENSKELINKALGLMNKHSNELRSFQKNLERVYKVADKAIQELGINRNTFQVMDDLDEIRNKAKEEIKLNDSRMSKIESIR
jgi:DNA repair ATPase RecN